MRLLEVWLGTTKMPYMKPSEIYFSQDSISSVFGNYCRHRGVHIGTTLDRLCEGQMTVSDIPVIGVMEKGGRWYSGDNRRLWIFRELERLGKCKDIFVNLTYVPSKKFTTRNRGESVRVRGDPGGSWHFKTSKSTNRMSILSYRSPRDTAINSTIGDNREDMEPNRSHQHRPTYMFSNNNTTQFIQSNPSYRDTMYNTTSRPATAATFGASNVYPTSSHTQTIRQYEPRSSTGLSDQRGYSEKSETKYQHQQEGPRRIASTRSSSTYQRSSTIIATPESDSQILRSMSNLRISNNPTLKVVDPTNCRFMKQYISRWFDNGLSYKSLTDQLIFGHLTYMDIPPVKAYEAYGNFYVKDGNRRLKALQDARAIIGDVKIIVKVIGDVDDLLNKLREEGCLLTLYDLLFLGKRVSVYK